MANKKQSTARRKPAWPLLAFSVGALVFFGYQYVDDFRSGVPTASIVLGLGVFGLVFGIVSHMRLSGLPDMATEPQAVRSIAAPSAIAGILVAVVLFATGL